MRQDIMIKSEQEFFKDYTLSKTCELLNSPENNRVTEILYVGNQVNDELMIYKVQTHCPLVIRTPITFPLRFSTKLKKGLPQ